MTAARTSRTGRQLGTAALLAVAAGGCLGGGVQANSPTAAPTPITTSAPAALGRPALPTPQTRRPPAAAHRPNRPPTLRPAVPSPPAVPASPPPAAPSQPPAAAAAPANQYPAVVSHAVVELDPGHDGGNAANPGFINQLVDAGRGRTKACDTVGTQTFDGYPEHAFTFDVASRAGAILAAHGVTALLTRPDDAGVGPCVDQRAQFGNTHHVAAHIAIHADGADPSGSGFHVIEAATPPAGAATGAQSHRLALVLRARMLAESGFGYSTYIGNGQALDQRDDLAGLNLAAQPAVFVECGNMRNALDAARLESPAGRQRVAQAIADTVLAFLAGASS